MNDLYLWMAAPVLIGATYLAALNLAMLRLNRSGAQQQLETKGKEAAARWLAAHFDAAIFGVSLLRTMARLAFFVLLLAALVDPGPDAAIGWGDLLLTGIGHLTTNTGDPVSDAAVAIELVLSLVEPQSSGIGGGAFMLYYDAAAEPTDRIQAFAGRQTAHLRCAEHGISEVETQAGCQLPGMRG